MQRETNLRPVVIGCTGGSGSRMLRDILASSRDIFMDQHVSPYSKDSYACKPLLHRRDQDSFEFRSALAEFSDGVRAQISQADLARLRYFGWKRPGMLAHVDALMDMDPQLRFVHLVRHPAALVDGKIGRKRYKRYRDALEPGTAAGRTEFILAEWAGANLAVWNRHRENPRYHLVRYEDVLGDTLETIETLFGWLEVNRADCAAAVRAVSPPLNALSRGREIDVSMIADALAAFGYTSRPANTPDRARRTEPTCS